MANTINASTSSGLIQTADTSGIIQLQNNSTTKLAVSSSGVDIAQYNPSTSLISSATATAASGNFIDFTGIPSWAKRITVMFSGVSTNGSALPIVRLGVSGTPQTTGYQGIVANQGTTAAAYANLSSSFAILQSSGAGVVFYGQMIISNVGSNVWVATGQVGRTDNTFLSSCQGSVSLSGTLNMVRITTDNGTDYFDAGTVNILYE